MKGKERNLFSSTGLQKVVYSSLKPKTLRNSKSGVHLVPPKVEKVKSTNQSYYRKCTQHSYSKLN